MQTHNHTKKKKLKQRERERERFKQTKKIQISRWEMNWRIQNSSEFN